LKASLIKLATDADEGSFREVFADQGQVTVAGCKARDFKGHMPEVQVKTWDALSETKRQKIIEAGIIKIVPHYSRDFHGRCNVTLF
jgi:hypothetical protein